MMLICLIFRQLILHNKIPIHTYTKLLILKTVGCAIVFGHS